MKHFMKTLRTPVGEMALAATEESVVALVWNREELRRIGIPVWMEEVESDLLREASRQLEEYFRRERNRFDLPFRPQGTEFQQRVWFELTRIPYGETWSYQELAKRVCSPGAVRAVGTANGRNPVCIFIPCHRVVRLSGEPGGYAGGVGNKAFLLELEGAMKVHRAE
jgi:methylated-DNA-[protein]-cysteine S-methyltransferase